ncbi:hypothetical protein QYE76_009242 [Lolium multiflorum]|uniref:CCHC-type domain-containing protein n=1 Tax=Lolium multiflorum TaxID=4521 RepID=A0AAD8TRM1_LOLMU|nr:hypothetical protein QYE76_009242 [Lolium multiflorum]
MGPAAARLRKVFRIVALTGGFATEALSRRKGNAGATRGAQGQAGAQGPGPRRPISCCLVAPLLYLFASKKYREELGAPHAQQRGQGVGRPLVWAHQPPPRLPFRLLKVFVTKTLGRLTKPEKPSEPPPSRNQDSGDKSRFARRRTGIAPAIATAIFTAIAASMMRREPNNAQKHRNNSTGGFAPRYNKPPAQTYRPNYTNNNGGPPKPGGNNNNNSHNNNSHNNNNNNNTGPRTRSNDVPVTPKDKSTVNCYECGVVGHYSNEFPKKHAKIAANTAAPAQQQRRFAAKRNPNNRNSHLYHMSATEAQEAPQAMPSRFSC